MHIAIELHNKFQALIILCTTGTVFREAPFHSLKSFQLTWSMECIEFYQLCELPPSSWGFIVTV